MTRNGLTSFRSKAKFREQQYKEELRLQEAVSIIQKAGIRQTPSNTYYGISVSAVALQFGVDYQKLRRRLAGVTNRSESHTARMKLSPAQEHILVEWIKSLGYRSIPWTPQIIREKASLISGQYIGIGWVYRFLVRHPDLKSRITVGLESCRAQALNRTTTSEFFAMLQETITEYDIKPENLYNMDEKGVQMGVGARARVLVDRNQKTVYMKTDGNRELVTLVECVCADGTALSPLAIFKGKRTNPRWALGNRINASIASSPNGWTDAELGTLWLGLVFVPQTQCKLTSALDYRLLILDGHSSHCTLKFLASAEEHRIVILCLPPHTTHALQPCDVGIFGPLGTHYRKEVTRLSKLNIAIRKENLLRVYGKARIASFSAATIKSAFRKTGIHPLDSTILPDRIFAPALTTTTKEAQPLSTMPPSFINAIPVPILPVSQPEYEEPNLNNPNDSLLPSPVFDDHLSDTSEDHQPVPKFKLVLPDLPNILPPRAPRTELTAQINQLRQLLTQACQQIAADHAQKTLMDQENGQLRTQLFQKTKEKDNSRALTSSARVLTHQDTLILLQVCRYAVRMKDVHEDLPKAVSARAKQLELKEKEKQRTANEARQATERQQRETERLRKEAERQAEKHRKSAEREAIRKAREMEREAEKSRKAVERIRRAGEKRKQMEQRAAAKESRPKRPKHTKHNSVISPSTLTAEQQAEKENAHPNHPVPLATPSFSSTCPLQSTSTTSFTLNTDGNPTLQGLEEGMDTTIEHKSPARLSFGLHNIDPQLLGP